MRPVRHWQSMNNEGRSAPCYGPSKLTPPKEQIVEQVWFTGVHCDVGGGYLVHELSDIPLPRLP